MLTRRKALIFIAGEGGHMVQMRRLINELNIAKYGGRAKLILITDANLLDFDLHKHFNAIYVLPQIRNKSSVFSTMFFLPYTVMRNIIVSLYLYIAYDVRLSISTGPGVAVAPILLGYIFKRKSIFIETWSKYTSLTKTGRICKRFVSYFFIQNRELQEFVTEGIYVGRL